MTTLTISNPRAPRPEDKHQMRRVFSGFAYDTKTASVLYHWDLVWHSSPDDDDQGYVGKNQITQTLYETTRGAHFILVYNELLDPWEKGYHEIRPLSRKAAIDWAEVHCQWLIEELFGCMPEPGEAEPYTEMPPPVPPV